MVFATTVYFRLMIMIHPSIDTFRIHYFQMLAIAKEDVHMSLSSKIINIMFVILL